MEDKTNRLEIIKEIQDRFRFIILIAIFLYTILSSASDSRRVEFAISYGGLVGMYFLAFFLFEILKMKFSLVWLKIINISTLVGIGIFIAILLIFVFITKIPTGVVGWILKIPMFMIMILPVFLTTIISLPSIKNK
jgi:hypothetical protein